MSKAEEQTPDTDEQGTAPVAPRRKRRWPALLALLLTLVAITGALLLSGQLDRYLSASLRHSAPADITKTAPVQRPARKTAVQPKPAAQPVRTPPRAEVAPTPPPPPRHPGMSSDEARALMQSIDGLNRSIRSLQQQQQALQNALAKQQQMQLTIRLRWITAEDSKLPQIAMAWEEIYLLPELSEEQRAQAETMLRLANRDLMQLRRWQTTLEHWATHLAAPRQPDIIPHPEHPWLAWIASQFHLRKAPTADVAQLDELSHQLLAVAQSLHMEQWPDAQQWKQLRARLILLAEEQQMNMDLPESFQAIAADKATLQATAKAWLEGDR